jgi:hypothetical protein
MQSIEAKDRVMTGLSCNVDIMRCCNALRHKRWKLVSSKFSKSRLRRIHQHACNGSTSCNRQGRLLQHCATVPDLSLAGAGSCHWAGGRSARVHAGSSHQAVWSTIAALARLHSRNAMPADACHWLCTCCREGCPVEPLYERPLALHRATNSH